WKRWFHTVDISPELRVAPPWESDEAQEGPGWTVVIEPGMAFGTGQHETTILCLERLVQLRHDGGLPTTMLDVGCGTGILGIAAHFMGSEEVVGVDCDPDAIVNARENVGRNQLDPSALRLSTTPVEEVSGEFPLVIANILAHILLDLAPALVARTQVGGMLVLSGILQEQVAALEGRFAALGAVCEGREIRGPWVRCDLRRQA
ncbi:MAG: 50S ribosomal protein L11 methyltransferase, partial [Myxococcota bacterium]|nr:50S ribosomal protein L11 methyltransferase [Myxococcota bacterium]